MKQYKMRLPLQHFIKGYEIYILSDPGVTHYVMLHSSPLVQLTKETLFAMNIHNSGEYSIANQNDDNIALLSYAEDSFSSSVTKNNAGKPDKHFRHQLWPRSAIIIR